ncbi:MAG: helix-turn-helix domain-containing protein [Bacteroidales bacterium]|jgi:predicted transcriptional regulator|nr:helix-turn-helix domain-containing protein [Bacteroidales bacterium]
MEEEIHIGKIIKQKFEEMQISITDFAKKINCTSQNVYHIFDSISIDINRLEQISKVLNFDFIKEIYLKQHIFLHPIVFTIKIEITDIQSIEKHKLLIDKLKEIEFLLNEEKKCK